MLLMYILFIINIILIKHIMYELTVTWFGYKTSAWSTRLTLASFIYGNDAELIFVTFNQTINNSLRFVIDCFTSSFPYSTNK